MAEMSAEWAKEELIRVLELDPSMDWDDIVYYAAKAKANVRMNLATIKRRHDLLLDATGLPEQTPWPAVVRAVEERFAGER